MPLYGNLRTLPLEDLLRWAAANQRTGVLQVERNAISKRVEFRKGWVGSCSSNEPSSLLGQFLLARGRINELQLQHLLLLRKATRKRLGLLMVELNILTRAELANEIAAKAQETIHSLFDWDEAFFRFDEGATLDPDQIEVNLSVEELIAQGRKRCEELCEIRNVFSSSGVVLVRTGVEAAAELLDRPMTRRILDAIDGKRTIAEILLHTRVSEFRVLQLLHRLYGRGVLTIHEIRTVACESATLLDLPAAAKTLAAGGDGAENADLAPIEIDGEVENELDAEIERALQLIERLEFEGAVELLRGVCRHHPHDFARRLLLKAETGFLSSFTEDSFVSQVPVLLRDRLELQDEEMLPAESFLLSMIDGTTDIQSIMWLTPLREIEILTALRKLAGSGVIDLREADAVDSGSISAPVETAS